MGSYPHFMKPVAGCECALCERLIRIAEEKAAEDYDTMIKPDSCPVCNKMSVAEFYYDGELFEACSTPGCFWVTKVEENAG